jgi:hypothetical protein
MSTLNGPSWDEATRDERLQEQEFLRAEMLVSPKVWPPIGWPEWKQTALPALSEMLEAGNWFQKLSVEEQQALKQEHGLESITDIGRYWVHSIKDKV